MKIELLREGDRLAGFHSYSCGPRHGIITRSLPYYRSSFRSRGRSYAHRVRSGHVHMHAWNREPGWDTSAPRQYLDVPELRWSVRLWCGQSGSSKHGEVYAEPGLEDVCATCEGRAVANGYPSSIVLLTRPIAFRPRL